MNPTPQEAFQKALSYHQSGQFDHAERLYLQLIDTDPSFALAYQNLVDIALRQGEEKVALNYSRKAAEILPESAGAQYNLGHLLYTFGEKTQARTAFEQAVSLDPNLILAWLNLGSLKSEAGDNEGALELHKKAEALNPDYGPTLKCIGKVLHVLGEETLAREYYGRALKALPTDAELMAILGNMLMEEGKGAEAEIYLRQSLAIDPTNQQLKQSLNLLEGAKIPDWHFHMLADTARNKAFQVAIEKAVTPGSLVLDIGTGSGLLSMMAARAGAEKVITCEVIPTLAETAAQVVKDNGYAEKITVFNKRSSSLELGTDLPRKPDVIVSEILDVGLLGEQVLPTLRHALATFANEQTILIPIKVKVQAQLIDSPHFRAIDPLGEISGFDLSAFDKYRPLDKYRHVSLATLPYTPLSDVFHCFTLDFKQLPPYAEDANPNKIPLKVKVNQSGELHGVAFWFEMYTDEETCVSSGPDGEMLHWGQAIYMLPQDEKVKAGEEIDLVLLQSETLIRFRVK